MAEKSEFPETHSMLNGALKSDKENHEIKYEEDVNLPLKRQVLAACGSVLLTLGAGATSGYSAVLLPQLKHESGDVKLSREIESWVAAISCLPLFAGNLISGYLMERFGRRYSQLMLSIPFVAGWTIICFSTNISTILLGRFITGFCQGWLGPLGPVFVGEMSTPKYRGFLLAALSLSIAVGVLASHLYGTFLHWKLTAILCGIFPMAAYVILLNVPETPSWLASKGKIDECIKSFEWYKGKGSEAKSELDKMIAQYSQQNKHDSLPYAKRLLGNIRKPEFRKPLGIMTAFFVITQLCGVNVICAYTNEIMKKLANGHMDEFIAMLIADILRCGALVVACILLRRVGRRPLAMTSGSLTALCLISLGIYLYLVEANYIHHLSPVITLGLMSLNIIISSIGIVPLPWTMVGEMFPSATRGLGSGISVMMTSLAFFTTVKTAPALFDDIGFEGTYLLYGICTLLGTIFLWFFLPETKGKTLLQVEENFKRNKKNPEVSNIPNV